MPAKVGLPFRLMAKLDERAGDRLAAVVADGRDAAAVEVLEDHALDQVVDVLLGERQIDASIAVDFAATGGSSRRRC